MSEKVNIYEAKAKLSHLVERAAAGEEIVIARAGKPRARLVPLSAKKISIRFGAWKGKVFISEDFDAPLPPDIERAFDGDGGS